MSRTSPRFATLLVGLLVSLGASAQAGDPVRGRDMWSDTPGISGNQMINGSCSNCHTIADRRNVISNGGGTFADIAFDTAFNRVGTAIANQSAMVTFRPLLQSVQQQDVRDLAAYVADTPKTTATALDFTASTVNVATATQVVDLRHSVAPLGAANLSITSVTIAGANASAFQISSNSCTTLMANGICTVGVRFTSPDTAGKTATLTFSLRQGTTDFTRSVALTGAVAVSSPPADSGGGALGPGWLALLALGTLALRQRRR